MLRMLDIIHSECYNIYTQNTQKYERWRQAVYSRNESKFPCRLGVAILVCMVFGSSMSFLAECRVYGIEVVSLFR
jgi:hypothetical protein